MSPVETKLSVPTDREFSDDEHEFILAIERYRRVKRRRFPSFREVLDVLKSLGYRKTQDGRKMTEDREPRTESSLCG